MFDLGDAVLRLSSEIQKDYPNSRTPPPTTIDLSNDDVGDALSRAAGSR